MRRVIFYLAEHPCRTNQRVAGEWKLDRGGEDPRGGNRAGAIEEDRLGEPEITRYPLHAVGVQPVDVGDHPEEVASDIAPGEDPNHVAVAHTAAPARLELTIP